jgi:hypothetical protein
VRGVRRVYLWSCSLPPLYCSISICGCERVVAVCCEALWRCVLLSPISISVVCLLFFSLFFVYLFVFVFFGAIPPFPSLILIPPIREQQIFWFTTHFCSFAHQCPRAVLARIGLWSGPCAFCSAACLSSPLVLRFLPLSSSPFAPSLNVSFRLPARIFTCSEL